MSTIENTVHEALTANGLDQYGDRARPVVAALVEREQAITDGLITLVVQHGIASKEQAVQVAEDFGLAVRPEPEPEPVTVQDAETTEAPAEESSLSVNALLQSISDRLDSLAGFARQHGYRG